MPAVRTSREYATETSTKHFNFETQVLLVDGESRLNCDYPSCKDESGNPLTKFRRVLDLQRHWRIIHGFDPPTHKCPVEDCSFSTHYISNFNNHLRKEGLLDPLRCPAPACGKEFTHSSSYNRHKKDKHYVYKREKTLDTKSDLIGSSDTLGAVPPLVLAPDKASEALTLPGEHAASLGMQVFKFKLSNDACASRSYSSLRGLEGDVPVITTTISSRSQDGSDSLIKSRMPVSSDAVLSNNVNFNHCSNAETRLDPTLLAQPEELVYGTWPTTGLDITAAPVSYPHQMQMQAPYMSHITPGYYAPPGINTAVSSGLTSASPFQAPYEGLTLGVSNKWDMDAEIFEGEETILGSLSYMDLSSDPGYPNQHGDLDSQYQYKGHLQDINIANLPLSSAYTFPHIPTPASFIATSESVQLDNWDQMKYAYLYPNNGECDNQSSQANQIMYSGLLNPMWTPSAF